MKNSIKTLLITGLVSVGLPACKEEFLEQNNPTQIPSQSYYKTSRDLDGALTAAYGAMQGVYGQLYVFTEVASDNTYTSAGAGGTQQGEFDLPPVSPNNPNLNSWNLHYQAIARANIVIERAVGVTMDEELKKRYVAEAKFLRALSYFNLVRIFGEVPLVLKEIINPAEAYGYGRESVDKVYQQIVGDLTEAEQVLPAKYNSNADYGRVTQGAVETLLGKVYLTRKNYPEAATKLKQVIDLAVYKLLSDYNEIFRINNANNDEVIFAVGYVKGGIGEGSPFTNNFAPHSSGADVVPTGEARGISQITNDLASAFEPSDLRKPVSVGDYKGVKYTRKYLDNPTRDNDADNDWIVLRYADVLLMYAEALNEQGNTSESLTYLNQVRQRAGLTEKTATDIPGQAAMRLALEQERRVELSMEGHRWFDLLRTGRAKEVMNAYYIKENVKRGNSVISLQDYMLLFPLPRTQVDLNPEYITQNPSY